MFIIQSFVVIWATLRKTQSHDPREFLNVMNSSSGATF